MASLDSYLKLFKDVDKALDGDNGNVSLTYTLSVESLTAALRCVNMKEGAEFIDRNLYRMARLMLSQNPERLSPTERQHINNSLQLVTDILLEITPESLFQNMNAAAMLVDESNIYYAGVTQMWSNYTSKGLPAERLKVLKKFAGSGGFERLCVYSASSGPEGQCVLWSNGENATDLSKLLRGLVDVDGEFAVKEAFVAEVIRGLGGVTDAQMKNDALLESLTEILEALKHICQYDVDISSQQFRLVQLFYPFWLSIVDKMLAGSKLQVRLLGWDQLNYLIVAAHKSKPRALKFVVRGAGATEVNGEYCFCRYNTDDQSVVYTKQPDEDHPEQPLLTLFRCKMRDKSRWWFISDADLTSPGTDKDTDYYHRVLDKDKTGGIDLEMTGPPLVKWANASSSGNRAKAPAPSLEPVGLIMNEGMTEEDFLVHKLKAYILEQDLVGQVFGSNMHREVVSRSLKTLFFMAENDGITADHLKLIWSAAMTMACDEDTAEEVLTALVRLCEKLPGPELYSSMMVAAKHSVEALNKEKDQKAASDQIGKIAMFLENFDENNLSVFQSKGGEAAGKVLELAWATMSSTHFEHSLREQDREIVTDLLTRVFATNTASGTPCPEWSGRAGEEVPAALVQYLPEGSTPSPPATDSTSSQSSGSGDNNSDNNTNEQVSSSSSSNSNSPVVATLSLTMLQKRDMQRSFDRAQSIKVLVSKILSCLTALSSSGSTDSVAARALRNAKFLLSLPSVIGNAAVATELDSAGAASIVLTDIRTVQESCIKAGSSSSSIPSAIRKGAAKVGAAPTADSALSKQYHEQLSLRLGVLHCLYSVSDEVNMTNENLTELWACFQPQQHQQSSSSAPQSDSSASSSNSSGSTSSVSERRRVEMHAFFSFLGTGVSHQPSSVSAMSPTRTTTHRLNQPALTAGNLAFANNNSKASSSGVSLMATHDGASVFATTRALAVLSSLLCSEELEWSYCSEAALDCLEYCYYHMTTTTSDDADFSSGSSGSDTLPRPAETEFLAAMWRASMHLSDRPPPSLPGQEDATSSSSSGGGGGESVVQRARDLLLFSHAQSEKGGAAASSDALLERILGALKEVSFAADEVSSSPSSSSLTREGGGSGEQTASRCLAVLTTAIVQQQSRYPVTTVDTSLLPHGTRGSLGRIEVKVTVRARKYVPTNADFGGRPVIPSTRWQGGSNDFDTSFDTEYGTGVDSYGPSSISTYGGGYNTTANSVVPIEEEITLRVHPAHSWAHLLSRIRAAIMGDASEASGSNGIASDPTTSIDLRNPSGTSSTAANSVGSSSDTDSYDLDSAIPSVRVPPGKFADSIGAWAVADGAQINVFIPTLLRESSSSGAGGAGATSSVFSMDNGDMDSDVMVDPAGVGREGAAVVGLAQQLAGDGDKFDTLMSLCEETQSTQIRREAWQLIMLLPTQEQQENRIALTEEPDWQTILASASLPRQTYALTIIAHILAPAPELLSGNSAPFMLERCAAFRAKFMQSGGFARVLDILCAAGSSNNNNNNNNNNSSGGVGYCNSSDVALRIVSLLIQPVGGSRSAASSTPGSPTSPSSPSTRGDAHFSSALRIDHPDQGAGRPTTAGSAGSESADSSDWQSSLAATERTNAAATAVSLTGLVAPLLSEMLTRTAELLPGLLRVAAHGAQQGSSAVVEDTLFVINALLTAPDVASQLIAQPSCRALLTTSLCSASSKVRDISSKFAVQLSATQPEPFVWLVDELERHMRPSTPSSRAGGNLKQLYRAVEDVLWLVARGGALASENSAQVNRLALVLVASLHAWGRPVSSSSSPTSSGDGGAASGNDSLCSSSSFADNLPALTGQLHLLEVLLVALAADGVTLDTDTVRGLRELGPLLVEGYLFPQPSSSSSPSSSGLETAAARLCSSGSARDTVFTLLQGLLTHSSGRFSDLTHLITEHVDAVLAPVVQSENAQVAEWGRSLSGGEVEKRGEGTPVGLKNQGCTCYMNSLLQQLFLCETFRSVVLSAEIPERYRSSIWHRRGAALVGCTIAITQPAKSSNATPSKPVQAKIVGYDEASGKHIMKMGSHTTPVDLSARMNSTTVVGSASGDDNHDDDDTLSEHEANACKVLEELQRTFCFMQYGTSKYFDPRPLVDACKTLNMTYGSYQQNDASEFFDQLLDRVEIATSLVQQQQQKPKNLWKNEILTQMFGGLTQYQKIPRDCTRFSTDKATCGHVLGAREEEFMKIDLKVGPRFASVHDSLSMFFESELMDGDNKINCDVCSEKKTTLRRCVLSRRPNLLILALKRFELDFEIFETVKLNHRLAFPDTLNVLQYTKEGVDWAEKEAERSEAQATSTSFTHPAPSLGAGVSNAGSGAATPRPTGAPGSAPGSPRSERRRSSRDASSANSPRRDRSLSTVSAAGGIELGYDDDDVLAPDPSDFEYSLQGVLVHSGVAGGGHYYSFAKDSVDPSSGRWYRYDDDEITEWGYDDDRLAYDCFGGSVADRVTGMERDRSANGLILFYSKNRPNSPASDQVTATAGITPPAPPVAQGDGKEGVAMPPPAPGTAVDPIAATTATTVPPGRMPVCGRDAFFAEVLSQNSAQLRNDYMLDTGLHEFVRKLVLGQVDGAAAPATSPTLPPEGSADTGTLQTFAFAVTFFFNVVLRSRDRLNMDGWLSALTLSMQTYPAHQQWFWEQLLLPAPSFLVEGVVSRAQAPQGKFGWLGGYLSKCPDSRTRAVFCSLLERAMSVSVSTELSATSKDRVASLLSQPLEVSVTLFQEQCATSSLAAAAPDGSDCHPLMQTLLALLLKRLLALSIEIMNFHLRAASLLALLSSLAASRDSLRALLVKAGLIETLAFLPLLDKAPRELHRKFNRALISYADSLSDAERTKRLQVVSEMKAREKQERRSRSLPDEPESSPPLAPLLVWRQDYTTLLRDIYLCLAALVGAAQPCRVPLLADCKVLGEHTFTEGALAALTTIFAERSRHGAMREDALQSLLEGAWGRTKATAPQTLGSVCDKYGHGSSRALREGGFIQYLLTVALHEEGMVWKLLDKMDFTDDLKRKEIGVGAGISTPRVAAGMVPPSLNLTEKMPFSNLQGLTLATLDLWRYGLFLERNATAALAAQCFSYNWQLAATILKDALHSFYYRCTHLDRNQAFSDDVQSANFVSVALLALTAPDHEADQLQKTAVLLFDSEVGIVTEILQGQSEEGRGRGTTPSGRKMCDIASDLLREFNSDPATAVLFHQRIEADNNSSKSQDTARGQLLQHLLEQVQYAGGDDASLSRVTSSEVSMADSTDIDFYRNYEVEVREAGTMELNGIYTFTTMRSGSAVFERTGLYRGLQVIFSMYQCPCQVGEGANARDIPQWFLGICMDSPAHDLTGAPSSVSAAGESGVKLDGDSRVVEDIDFYTADIAANATLIVPTDTMTWKLSPPHGRAPAPTVRVTYIDDLATPPRRNMSRGGSMPGSPSVSSDQGSPYGYNQQQQQRQLYHHHHHQQQQQQQRQQWGAADDGEADYDSPDYSPVASPGRGGSSSSSSSSSSNSRGGGGHSHIAYSSSPGGGQSALAPSAMPAGIPAVSTSLVGDDDMDNDSVEARTGGMSDEDADDDDDSLGDYENLGVP